MVREYSTSGGHLTSDEVIELPQKTPTKKWQGYPPENLNVVGKAIPALPEVSVPRFTGKAQYASRVWFPNMLYAAFLTCPHPHAKIRNIETSTAEKMPGAAYILTHRNVPKRQSNILIGSRGGSPAVVPEPLGEELNLQGEPAAIVDDEGENLAQDAASAIQVEYEVLPFASTLKDAM